MFEGIDGNGGRVQVGESLEAVADSRIHGSPSWGVCIRFMLNVMYHVIANELFVLKVFRRRASVETMVMNEPNRTDQFGVGRCLALAGMHTLRSGGYRCRPRLRLSLQTAEFGSP